MVFELACENNFLKFLREEKMRGSRKPVFFLFSNFKKKHTQFYYQEKEEKKQDCASKSNKKEAEDGDVIEAIIDSILHPAEEETPPFRIEGIGSTPTQNAGQQNKSSQEGWARRRDDAAVIVVRIITCVIGRWGSVATGRYRDNGGRNPGITARGEEKKKTTIGGPMTPWHGIRGRKKIARCRTCPTFYRGIVPPHSIPG